MGIAGRAYQLGLGALDLLLAGARHVAVRRAHADIVLRDAPDELRLRGLDRGDRRRGVGGRGGAGRVLRRLPRLLLRALLRELGGAAAGDAVHGVAPAGSAPDRFFVALAASPSQLPPSLAGRAPGGDGLHAVAFSD